MTVTILLIEFAWGEKHPLKLDITSGDPKWEYP